MDYLSVIIPSLLPQIPHLIFQAAGLWLAISRRAQHPRIYLVAAVYFGLALLVRIASQVYVILPIYMQQQGLPLTNIESIYTTLNLVCIPFTVVMDVALLYAMFSPRSKPDVGPNTPIFAGDKNG